MRARDEVSFGRLEAADASSTSFASSDGGGGDVFRFAGGGESDGSILRRFGIVIGLAMSATGEWKLAN